MKDASSEHSQTTALAISLGSAMRLSGVIALNALLRLRRSVNLLQGLAGCLLASLGVEFQAFEKACTPLSGYGRSEVRADKLSCFDMLLQARKAVARAVLKPALHEELFHEGTEQAKFHLVANFGVN